MSNHRHDRFSQTPEHGRGLSHFRPALLLIDPQKESNFGILNVTQVIQKAGKVIAKCREHDIPVIFTRQINRADGIGLSLYEPFTLEGKPYFYPSDSENIEIFPELQPEKADLVIDKHRWSGFYGTNLDMMLRSMRIDHLIVGGFVTDGCVMTSVFDAYFRDFHITLVEDICSATSEGAHKAAVMLMCNWVYGLQVFQAEELIKHLDGKKAEAWTASWPDELKFSPDDLSQVYQKIHEDTDEVPSR